jgi:hypothetical protein
MHDFQQAHCYGGAISTAPESLSQRSFKPDCPDLPERAGSTGSGLRSGLFRVTRKIRFETAVIVASLLALAGCGRDEAAPAKDSAVSRAEPTILATPRESRVSTACIAPGRGPWEPTPVGAARFVVNRGTRGMGTRVGWLLAPDSSALFVVDDPWAVEADPVPNAVLHASERTGRVWRADSVWSAAPSPDWRQVAFGRAVFLRGNSDDRVTDEQWRQAAAALARLAGPHLALAVDSLRARAFSASGMGIAEGAAATFVADVGTGAVTAPLRFVSPGGWRVGWSCDGASLLVSDRPARGGGQDGAPGEPARRVALAAVASAAPADSLRWTEGPALEIGVALPRDAVAPLRVRGRTVALRAGRIVVRDAGGAVRDVGPGIPLAATRGARFILAIVPRLSPRPYESPDEAVVYRVP